MIEPIIASIVFWASFVFSLGPFWTAIMAAAQTMSYKELYKNYLFYQLIGGAPQIMLIVFLVISLENGMKVCSYLLLHWSGSDFLSSL